MDVKFYLKRPDEKGKTAIYCLCHFGYKELTSTGKEKFKPVKIYTTLKIDPKYWDAKKNRAKETTKFAEYPEFNDSLIQIASNLNSFYLELKKKHTVVTPAMFKEEWNAIVKPETTKTDKNNSFDVFADSHIKNIEGKVRPGTLKNFRNSLGHIKDFAKSKNVSLEIDTIGFDFHFSMVEYLKTDKKFSINTIWRINKFLRYILKFATEKGITTRPDYQSKRFAIKPKEPDVIYLTETELQTIYNKELNNPKLERVRDLFLIGCYTGLRFSDFNRLNPNNIKEIDGKQFFKLTTKKTNDPVFIPLHPIVTAIIRKHKGIPKGMSNQKFNDYIKDVAELAELKELITVEETKGNLTTPVTNFKYDLVTSHTARRSFATNAFIAGVPVLSIMQITGHRTETAFMRYIRIGKEENAKLMSQHPFFNNPILKVAE